MYCCSLVPLNDWGGGGWRGVSGRVLRSWSFLPFFSDPGKDEVCFHVSYDSFQSLGSVDGR